MSNEVWPKKYAHPQMQELHEFISESAVKVRDGEATIEAAVEEAANSDLAKLYDLSPSWIEHHVSCFLERPEFQVPTGLRR